MNACEESIKLKISNIREELLSCNGRSPISTLAESNLYRTWGADVIGMTNMPEAKLAREAEIISMMITDFDCWYPDHDNADVKQIIETLSQNS